MDPRYFRKEHTFKLGSVPSKLAAFCVAVMVSYCLNRTWTFWSRTRKVKQQFSRFLLVSVGGVALSSVAIYVLVNHQPRSGGRSGYSLGKLAILAFNLFTNFSLLPLQLVSALGFVGAAGGFAIGFYYLIQYVVSNIPVPGYASTIVTVLILGGIQLLSLGIMGEYLGRPHLNVNRKPQYVER